MEKREKTKRYEFKGEIQKQLAQRKLEEENAEMGKLQLKLDAARKDLGALREAHESLQKEHENLQDSVQQAFRF